MVPKRKDELSEDDKKKALRYLMFMKEKPKSTGMRQQQATAYLHTEGRGKLAYSVT